MKILVTGGLGLIGHNVVQRLEAQAKDVEVRKGKTHATDGVYEAVYKGKVIGKFSFDKKEKMWVDAAGDKFAQKKDAISKFVLQYNMKSEAAAETTTAKGEGKGKAAPTGKAEPAPTTETKGETKPTGKAETKPQITAADVNVRKGPDFATEGVYEVMHNGKVIGRMYYDRSMSNAWMDADYTDTSPSDPKGILGSKAEAIDVFVNRYNANAKPTATTETKGETKPTETTETKTVSEAAPLSSVEATAKALEGVDEKSLSPIKEMFSNYFDIVGLFKDFKDAVSFNVRRTAKIGLDESNANYGEALPISNLKRLLNKAGIKYDVVNKSKMSDGNYASYDGEKIKITEEKIPLPILLHEIGESVIAELDKSKKKIQHSNNIFEAITTYGASRGNDAFADNFYLYFLSPKTLLDLSPNVYNELNRVIPQNIKELGKSLMQEYGVKEQSLSYSKDNTFISEA